MAQVLAPIVQTSGSITMLHSSPDAFQNQPTQPHHQQQRSSQMPRNQSYNATSPGTGYRGTSAPIAPYAFSSTPQLRQEMRSSSAPSQQALQQAHSANSRLAHPGHPTHASSSSDSTVSTSGSSSRSLAAPSFGTKDDDMRKSIVDGMASVSTSVPDLSLMTFPDVQGKPAPGRYRRPPPGRTDSTNSATASPSTPTPTQQSPAIGASTTSGLARPNPAPLTLEELPQPVRPGHNRASSVDDMQLPRGSSADAAKRYRRRSLSGFDANAMTTNTAPTAAAVSTAPITAPKRPTQELRPPSSSSRHGSRPTSSQSHERRGSSGSNVSNGSNRPSVSTWPLFITRC
jgi:hypothetical protein